MAIAAFAAVIGFTFSGCGDDDGTPSTTNPPGNTGISVTLTSVEANGANATTTLLTLTFGAAIEGLSAGDIAVSLTGGTTGLIVKGAFVDSGAPVYTLAISGHTSGGGANVTVTKTGYNISGSPKPVTLWFNGSNQAPSGGGSGSHVWEYEDNAEGWEVKLPQNSIVYEDTIERRVCKGNGPAHLPHAEERFLRYATGTPGLDLLAINGGTEYSVSRGSANLSSLLTVNGKKTLFIPAFNRDSTQTAVTDYKPVTAVVLNAFHDPDDSTGFQGIEAVVFLPGSQLKSIGPNAFENTGMESINIPASVTTIGEYAFSQNKKLTFARIPEGITLLDKHVFDGCELLTKVSFASEKNLLTVGEYAFSGCVKLDTITDFPKRSITSIGVQAFNGCVIARFEIHAQVNTIGDQAFKDWDGTSTKQIIDVIGKSIRTADAKWGKDADYTVPGTPGLTVTGGWRAGVNTNTPFRFEIDNPY